MSKQITAPDLSVPIANVSVKSSGPLHALPVPGMVPQFYTVDESGGTLHVSQLFTTGDIESVVPELRITYSPGHAGLIEEDADLAREMSELRSAASRFDSVPFPEGYDFRDILEP